LAETGAVARRLDVRVNCALRVLALAEPGNTSIDVPVYNTDWDSEAYLTVSGQNSNNSIRVSNDFLRAVEEDKEWALIRRTDKAVSKTLSARKLWDQVAYAAWASADPGVQFDTTMNEWHTCPADGRINATNPCVTGDTLVATSEGWRRIASMLDEGAEVIGSDRCRHPIAPAFITGFKPVYRLTTKAGYSLKLTGDHRVLTKNRGDVPACE